MLFLLWLLCCCGCPWTGLHLCCSFLDVCQGVESLDHVVTLSDLLRALHTVLAATAPSYILTSEGSFQVLHTLPSTPLSIFHTVLMMLVLVGVKWSRLTGLNVCSHEQNWDGNEECVFYLFIKYSYGISCVRDAALKCSVPCGSFMKPFCRWKN